MYNLHSSACISLGENNKIFPHANKVSSTVLLTLLTQLNVKLII